MIFSILRRNFTCSFSTNLWSLEKSRVPFSHSVSVLYFSTSGERKSVNNPVIYELLLNKYNLSPALSSHVVSVLTQSKPLEECDSVLSFFKEIGFTKSQLERTLKYLPKLLSSNLEKIIKPKIKIFQDMGFSNKGIADIISNDPNILYTSLNDKLIPRLNLLRVLLRSAKGVAMVLRKAQWMLSGDFEKNMLPNVELLKSCGVSMEQISTICCHTPRLFLSNPEVVRKYADQVDELGVNRSSKVFVYAVAVVGSMPNGKWEQKLQAFRDILHCSEDDILRVVRHTPQVFTVSEDKMRKVKEFLLGTRKYTTSCIIEWPRSLMHSIEQRYKPRIEVLEVLESRHLIETWPLLSSLCRMPDHTFYKKYVNPHLKDLGEVYLAHRARSKKRGVELQ
ncbi:hypothetical protein C2S51_007682 [Perilla frutescens var. frutescens]|nr:hypothetical protein C2S51_007682 [Perilla frutescens var. frutescens]